MEALDDLRVDLAKRSQWNIGYVAAGGVYWSFAAATAVVLPIADARVAWAVGGCCIFPLSILLSRVWGSDPFIRGNPLGALVGIAHTSLIVVLMPLLVVFYLRFPDGLLLAAALCLSGSYPVLSWAFGGRLLLWHAIVRVSGVTVIWFALPQSRDVVLAVFVALLYLMTTLLLPGERRTWLQAHQSSASHTSA